MSLKSLPAITSFLTNQVGFPALVAFDKCQHFTIYISEKFKAHMDANGNKAREIATADHIGIQHDGTFVFNAEVSKQLLIGFHVMLCSKTCCRDYMYSLCGTLSLLPNPYEYCQISMHMKVSKTSVRIYTQEENVLFTLHVSVFFLFQSRARTQQLGHNTPLVLSMVCMCWHFHYFLPQGCQ